MCSIRATTGQQVFGLDLTDRTGQVTFLHCAVADYDYFCRELRKDYGLYIITNGVASTQHNRLEKSGLADLMDDIFISDEIGYNKPDREFFEYVEKHIPGFERGKALVVGDSLFSDIRGGVDYGIDTCWLNIYNADNTSEIKPTYIIRDIVELPGLLKKL